MVDHISLYDIEGTSWNPNSPPEDGLHVQTPVYGSWTLSGRREALLYYAKLPGWYCDGGGEGGSCDIPMYSIEGDEGIREFNDED